MNIWLDLDAVIVNFRKRYKELTGECIRCRYVRGMSEEDIWDQVSMAGRDWWANLPWMDDGKELWDFIKKYNPNILSAAVDYPGCKDGKIDWCLRELQIPGEKIYIVSRKEKSIYASPNDLLIDDYDKNCIEWVNSGGLAIQHTDSKSTIEELRALIEKYDMPDAIV